MTATRPTVDLVQVFCVNFESTRDFSGPVSRRRDAPWPKLRGVSHSDLVEARISRYTLEVFNLVLSGDGEHLIREALPHYASLPAQKIASPTAIARVLVGSDPPLAEGSQQEIERQIERNIEEWRMKAIQILRRTGEH